jgi:hypothetical protein
MSTHSFAFILALAVLSTFRLCIFILIFFFDRSSPSLGKTTRSL